jgi:Type II CAAX prenyl endopeptidase Rce1-like
MFPIQTGMLGTLSLLFLDLYAIIAAVPLPADGEPPELPPLALLKILSLIQPAVLMTIAAAVGCALANRVGLHSPAAEALASGESVFAKLKPQIVSGIVAGIVSGIAIITAWLIAKPYLSPEFIARAEEFNRILPHATRFLYGGLTEEILLRWGFMTLLVWAAWKLLQKSDGSPRAALVIAAIVISALLFGAGHLPIASLLGGGLTFPLVMYVLIANSVFGIVAGFLYWKRGLESAMIAHIFTHVVLIAAISFV